MNGDVVRALSEELWSIFVVDGVHGELLISEHGPCICAVIDVLRKYLSEHPKIPNHPILHKWVTREGYLATVASGTPLGNIWLAPLQPHDIHDSDSDSSNDSDFDSFHSTVHENDLFQVDDDVDLASQVLKSMLTV